MSRNKASYDSLAATEPGAVGPSSLSRLFEPVKDRATTLLKGQNAQQRLQLLFTVPGAVFQMLASSFLVLTVPQLCGDVRACSVWENLTIQSPLHGGVLALNALTAAILLLLSVVEVQRENLLVEYLEVSPTLSFTGEAVKERLRQLRPTHEAKLHRVDGIYRVVAIGALVVFCINGLASAYLLFDNALNLQTYTTFAAYALLLGTRLAYSGYIAYSEAFVFFSVFLTNTVQFNDVDPHFVSDPNYDDHTTECELV